MSENNKLVFHDQVQQRNSGGGALIEQESQRAIAEVQSAIMLAKQFPRNQQEAYDRIMVACQRPTLAEQALYQYARGGTAITGPSIRMAEALAQNWGNLQFGIRELSQANGESTVEAFAWDVETNVRQVKVFQVPHKRHTRKETYALTDPRDIYELVANNGARRLRACILGVIPGDIVDAAVAEVESTLKAKADTSADGVKRMLKSFADYKVTKEMIEKRIQRRIDSITPAQMVGLKKIYNSLKDGMSSAADWFEVVEDKPLEEQVGLKTDKQQDTGKQAGRKPQPKKQAEKKPAEAQEEQTDHDQGKAQSQQDRSNKALTGTHKELHDCLATACNGDEAEMGALLTGAIGVKTTVEDIAGLSESDAIRALGSVEDILQDNQQQDGQDGR